MKSSAFKRMAATAAALLVLCCGCASTPTGEDATTTTEPTLQTLPTSAPVVVPIGERTDEGVKVTIHAGLLGELGTTLTEQQIADGYIEAVRNEDESVTYTIDAEKYDAMIARYRKDARAAILYTLEDGSYYSLQAIDCAEDLSSITLQVKRSMYLDSMDALMVFGTGMIAVTAQAYDLDAPGQCIITVVDEAGETISQNVYPDELVL